MSRSTLGARFALTAAIASSTLLGGVAAAADPPTAAAPAGIYGAQDPTYDGVYRQSVSLLALEGAGVAPAPAAVDWLLDQQCADGGFLGFRADPKTPCAPAQEDSNATGLAAQALVAVGRSAQAYKAVGWITTNINADGGVGYNPGSATDANSTGVALSAFAATGRAAPASAAGALGALALGCDTDEADRGALDYQKQADAPLAPNDLATAQAVLGLAGQALPLSGGSVAADSPVLTCPASGTLTGSELASAGAGYLARRLVTSGGALPSAFGSGADYGTSADAALALVGSRHGADAVAATVTKLASVAGTWPKDAAGKDRPAAVAKLALVAQATGADPRAFGGSDLLARLQATLQTSAAPSPSASPTASPSAQPSVTSGTPSVAPGPRPATSVGTTGSLPDTGASTGELALLGAGSVLIGAALITASRTRTRRNASA